MDPNKDVCDRRYPPISALALFLAVRPQGAVRNSFRTLPGDEHPGARRCLRVAVSALAAGFRCSEVHLRVALAIRLAAVRPDVLFRAQLCNCRAGDLVPHPAVHGRDGPDAWFGSFASEGDRG